MTHLLALGFVSLLTASLSPSQVSVGFVSAGVGQARSILAFTRTGREYVPYPEVQLGGQWFAPGFEWSGYWGYWDDGVDEVRVSDAQVYSTHGHIVGGRLTLVPTRMLKRWPLPVGLIAGVAHHIARYQYVGGSDGLGTPVSNRTESTNTLELGARLFVTLSAAAELRAEGHQYFGIGETELAHAQSGRRSFTFGVALSF
jgi:hypothetical protein